MNFNFVHVIIISVLVFVADLLFAGNSDNGSLLIGTLFWAGIAQGLIAVSAAAHLSQAKWIKDFRGYMHQFYPLLLLFPIAFLIFGLRGHLSIYNWYGEHWNSWLEQNFFLIRNVIALTIPFIFAHFFIKAQERGDTKNTTAVFYLLSFVISNSFMGYDLIMSLEYPWMNTLLGPFFFIEAFYMALAFSAIISGMMKKHTDGKFKGPFNDFVQMTMGFGLFWGGMWFTQYIVIWYGNLPEEVNFVGKRMNDPSLFAIGVLMLLFCFVFPFFAFFNRKIKGSFKAVSTIMTLLLVGMIIERIIYLAPVSHLSFWGVLLPVIFLGAPFIMIIKSQLKAVAAESGS